MREFIDNIRLKISLFLEKNRNTEFRYDEEYGELVSSTSIHPIISLFFERTRGMKKIECVINGIKFTELEAILVHSFTADGSKYINHELASPNPNINCHLRIIIKTFDNVLRKIEQTDNEFIYRMDSYSRDYEESALSFFKNNEGKIVNIPWFLSTTEDSKPWNNKIVWEIHIKDKSRTKARHFYPFINNHGDEREIRFERNTKLQIVRTEKIENGDNENYYIIHMNEIYSRMFDINMDYTKYWQ